MLRVNSSNVLVVPPWECAWLSDEQLQLRDGAGCISFDVRGKCHMLLPAVAAQVSHMRITHCLPAGENDATVILKPTPGSKRTRYVRDLQAAAYLGNLHTDSNYTIILGSHRNSCLKFEKDLQPRHQASTTVWPPKFGFTHSPTLMAPENVFSITGLIDSSVTSCCLVWPQHICLRRQMASLAPS